MTIPDDVVAKAEEWRTNRSQEALNWLYWHFINGLPEGVPMEPLLALLGAPTRHSGTSYHFDSTLGPSGQACIYLEADLNGNLGGFKIN